MTAERPLASVRERFLEFEPRGGAFVVVPGRGGSWLRSLVPGLWGSSPRIVAVVPDAVVLLAASSGFIDVKRELWRGTPQQVRVRRYFAARVLRLRFPGPLFGRRVQVDGREACGMVLAALRP
jgi:hypothetical protein